MSQINLNHTTPAAPSGNTNVTWQADGSNNVSGYVPNATVPLTTKGDVLGYDTAPDRIPIGSNGQVLTADSTQALGLKWASPSSGGGISIGPIASLPVSVPAAGNMYVCTNSPYTFVSDGTNWQAFIFGYNVVQPILSAFTQQNQGLTTFTTANGGIAMACTSASGDNLQWISQAVPATPYYVDVAFMLSMKDNTGNFGVGLSDGTKVTMITFGWESGNANWIKRVQFNSQTSFNNNASAGTVGNWVGPLIWLRIQNDGTNLTYSYSVDGNTWTQLLQEGATAFLTATLALFGGDPVSIAIFARLVHFSIHT
jgi:hypothetical protein